MINAIFMFKPDERAGAIALGIGGSSLIVQSRSSYHVDGLADSKRPKRREKLFAVISAGAVAIGIGRTDMKEVDRLNIYWAAMQAHRRTPPYPQRSRLLRSPLTSNDLARWLANRPSNNTWPPSGSCSTI
jgi:hypothetical protein